MSLFSPFAAHGACLRYFCTVVECRGDSQRCDVAQWLTSKASSSIFNFSALLLDSRNVRKADESACGIDVFGIRVIWSWNATNYGDFGMARNERDHDATSKPRQFEQTAKGPNLDSNPKSGPLVSRSHNATAGSETLLLIPSLL